MKLLFAAAAMLALAGCANVTSAIDTITSSKVSPASVAIAVNAFDAAKVTAKNYLVYCTPVPAPVGCDDSAIQAKLVPAINAGTTARNSLEDFLASHPGELGDAGVYDALKTATDTIQQIVSAYHG
uniref:hypothetical protein n=1 Tax=Mesorhizobium sp. 131-3-5 TaxID=2744520 RepID=UPI001927F05D|nr:hypothetical protein [Mesorhizobium sp. 131-3-5]BCH11920.1 hypothetical protein MesoLj131c_61780 [Mesorhizobium sp. 131-3-5]